MANRWLTLRKLCGSGPTDLLILCTSVIYLYSKPSSVVAQPALCRNWSENPKTDFLVMWFKIMLFAIVSGPGFRYSPAEIQDDLAIASIENVFVYSDRYGHFDLKSD